MTDLHQFSSKTAGWSDLKQNEQKMESASGNEYQGFANIKVAIRLRPMLEEETSKGLEHIGSRMKLEHNRV